MTLNPQCESVETAQGVPLSVTGVAQCKIMKADELLQTASEQFLGKTVKEIRSTILQTLEGHLRAILGTLTVEEVYRDRDQFAALVREVAAPDVGRMGIEILSFTIKDVYDEVQYLSSLGKAQTAMVKRDADAGVAEANRDAGIREAECQKSAMDIKYSTDTKIEDNARMFKLQKANFDQEINTAKAQAQLAYELQAAKIRQKIRNEEIQIDVVERRKQIEIETQEVMRKERELNATVRLPAEAESYKMQMLAEGKGTQTVQKAQAESEKIKLIGAAEASAIASIGKADAERMRMKAAVYKQYDNAAIMSIVLEALPKTTLYSQVDSTSSSSSSKDDELLRLRLKVKTLKKKLKRSRRTSMSPNLSSENGGSGNENEPDFVSVHNYDESEVISPQDGDKDPLVVIQTQTNEQTEPALKEHVRFILGQWQHILTEGLQEDVRKELIEKYPIPSNCPLLSPPKINPEAKVASSTSAIKRDQLSEKQRQIAAEVAAPLAKTEEIVLIGGQDNATGEITRLVGQIPPAVNALTGIDLSKVLGKIPGATQTTVAPVK